MKHVTIIMRLQNVATLVKTVTTGIYDYAQNQCSCRFSVYELSPDVFDRLQREPTDGAIAVGLTHNEAWLPKLLKESGIPSVHVGELHAELPIPEIRSPNRVVGRLGAEHLLSRGLRRFAFIGESLRLTVARKQGFADALAERGLGCDGRLLETDADWKKEIDDFLATVQYPVGIMANRDMIGCLVVDRAMRLGIDVPSQLAVVSVGNEEPWCTLAARPLSSIELPGAAMGRVALTILMDLMVGKPVPMDTELPATHLIERQSSAMVYGVSPDVAAAVRLIREQRGIGIWPAQVASRIGISLSTLERGVKLALGHTPMQEILRLRLQAAKQLLRETDLPIKLIASRCGFRSSRYLSVAIRKDTGQSPRQYRAQHRAHFS